MNRFDYTGYRKWEPTDLECAEFYTTGNVPFELQENEYLIIKFADGQKGFYRCEAHKLVQLHGGSLSFELKKDKAGEQSDEATAAEKSKKRSKSPYKSAKVNTITPKNEEQICAFDLLNNDKITCKLLTGSYGSGKTMLAVYAAMQMLNEGKIDKIIWLRNNVTAAGAESIGYLPGDQLEKLKPFLGPFIDHLQGEARVEKLLEKGQLEVPALGFIRGRNLDRCVIICSEAQNLTEELVKLIIAKAGEGSYLIFDGDFKHQVDRPLFEKSPGLKRMIEVLAGNPLFGYVDLPKSERSATARLADEFEN